MTNTNKLHHKVVAFIDSNNVLSYCSSVNNKPHCVSCFYSFLKKEAFLIFKSSSNTTHINKALTNNAVAGTITLNINKIGIVKGIQFSGIFTKPKEILLKKIKPNYYKRYPFALTMPGNLWCIELTYIKMIDNTLGFGNKITWNKKEAGSNIAY